MTKHRGKKRFTCQSHKLDTLGSTPIPVIKRFNKRRAKKKLEANVWKRMREFAISRDKGCVICGRIDKINVHHLFPKEIKEFKYYLPNLICLCPNHHKYSLDVSPHKNPIMFYEWMYKNRLVQIVELRMGRLLK